MAERVSRGTHVAHVGQIFNELEAEFEGEEKAACPLRTHVSQLNY
jgi:hypothetical protein